MKESTARSALKKDIQQLTEKQMHEWLLLKIEFLSTYESLKPLNLLKSTWKEASAMPEIQNKLVNNAVGLTAGFLSNVLLPGKGIFATLFQIGVADIATRNAQTVKQLAVYMMSFFKKKRDMKI